jgi:hypothetical protein
MDAFSFAIPLLIGFALGYGVREIISRRRHREAPHRREMIDGWAASVGGFFFYGPVRALAAPKR